MSGLLCVRDFCLTKAACLKHAGLLRQASVELDEPVSWHPALRADHAQVGKTCPLAGLVRSGLPGVTGAEATSCRRASALGLTSGTTQHVDEVTAAAGLSDPDRTCLNNPFERILKLVVRKSKNATLLS
jgi:hypothetical protein